MATLILSHAGIHSQYAANAYIHSNGYDPGAAYMVMHIPYDLSDVTEASGVFFYYVKR